MQSTISKTSAGTTAGGQMKAQQSITSKQIKKVPSQLIKEQASGRNIDSQFLKPKIIQHFNITDNSIYADSQVPINEPLFSPEPYCIKFADYEPLQVKEQILRLRNKDKVARSVKIIPPDSKLFQVQACKKVQKGKTNGKSSNDFKSAEDIDNMSGRVAPGMEISFIIKFSPEAKSDYSYDLMVLSEREKFIVPVRAVGCRSMIDFPDQLDFGSVPVKHVTEKPVIIRNVGEKTTKWKINTPSGFELSKNEGILEIGQSEQLVFKFIPQESRQYRDELQLLYDGLEAVVPILGEAHNDNVYLSKSHIHMDPTSITLYSHQYYTIVNKSQVPIEFSWRAFSTDKEELEKKTRLNNQLIQEESEERALIETGEEMDSAPESLDSDDSYNQVELQLKKQRAKEKAIATLARKYQGIRKAVDDDPMLFQDEIFSIEPLDGKIWPNTEITFCVTFRPQGPYHYSCTAFCNTTCSEERLALNMTGQGKGPQAQLSLPEQDIGDVFVNYQKEFAVGIENTGEIDCHWKLIPYETPFGSKFHFSKTEGVLGVSQSIRDLIKITFKSDILGEFSETFRFALEGSSEMLSLTFKGHVVAPTFKFSEDIIDFGKVSYKFPVKKIVYLSNTSEVDINYRVRVPGDRAIPNQQEFFIKNAVGTLEKAKDAEIEIEFVPSQQQPYDMVLVVDLDGVGEDMLAVPVKAECLVPKVQLVIKDQIDKKLKDVLDFDVCFLRHPKTKQIEIVNLDPLLQAKYEFVPQDEQSKRIAVYTADKSAGIIAPNSSQIINIQLRAEILSPVNIPLQIKIEGVPKPEMIFIQAKPTGPQVDANKEELDFGNVEVLKDFTEKLKIVNNSKIQAEYTAFTKQKESIWKVIQRHGILQPDQTAEIEVVCNADEIMKFQDTLHIIINNGQDLEIALKAKGIGSTLYCKASNLKVVSFGTEYTHQNITKEFFLENRGRKQMKIQWVRQNKGGSKQKKASDTQAKDKASESGKKPSGSESVAGTEKQEEDQEAKQIYAIVPDTMVLNPKMGYKVQFRANSFNIGEIKEQWQCLVTIGGERKPKVVYDTTVSGEFITPALTFDPPRLDFKYMWKKGIASMPINKILNLQNSGPLPTTITIKIDPPFSCSTEKVVLAKGGAETLSIDFDPGMKQDRLSDKIEKKLMISHVGHVHKDSVLLQGEVCFPNLQIVPPNIDFGCILNDTSKRKYLVLTNISEMPVSYEWSFLEEENLSQLNAVQEEDENVGKKKKKKPKVLPINEVFDILPVSGRLMPGQIETVEFTFQSGHGLLYNGVAVCSVDGGPDYEVPVIGESSFVDFKLSTTELDYGEIPFNESSSKEFFIENIGKVPFEFNINLSTVSRPGIIECNHMTGKVIAGERFKVIIKFFPGVPDNINEMLLVECGHFPAVRFKLKAVGIYPGLLLSLPRVQDNDYTKRLELAKHHIEHGEITYSTPFVAAEALKIMPATIEKAAEKEKSILKDPHLMEIEVEADRQYLCEKIVQKFISQSHHEYHSKDKHILSVKEVGSPGLGASSGRVATKKETKPKEKGAETAKTDEKAKDAIVDGVTINSDSHHHHVESISIANYVCDFGNVVVGSQKKKMFRLTNVGRIPVSFTLEKKNFAPAGLNIEPDKITKLMPNASALFNITYATRKTAKFGKSRILVPIDVKGGPSYNIEFVANLTIPELAMSSENLDFGKVCVQMRKTIKIRFENQKEIPCSWDYFWKPDITTAASVAKEGERFQIFPTSGTLFPGQRQTVDIMFTPNSDKLFTQKLTFKCRDNTKFFVLNVKGQGINYAVELIPETLVLGPVLPYDTSAVKIIELKNPMEQAIEVISQDFDKQYLEEEDILKHIEQFQYLSNEPLYMPLRLPGTEFWPSLKEQDEKRRRMDEIRDYLSKIEQELTDLAKEELAINEKPEGDASPPVKSQEEISERRNVLTESKCKYEAQLAEEKEESIEIRSVPVVKEKDRLNIIILGPKESGKTTLAKYLAQEHQRAVINLDQLFDWCTKRGSPLADEAQKYLDDQKEQYEIQLAELEKKKKAKKKGAKDEDPEINFSDFQYLSEGIVQRMIEERLKSDDCNAGAIFDNLESKYWKNVKTVVDLIHKAIPKQNLQVLMLKFNKEKVRSGGEGEDMELPVCTNYRFARRKLGMDNQGKEEKQQKIKEDVAEKKKQKKPEATKTKTQTGTNKKEGDKDGTNPKDNANKKEIEQAEIDKKVKEDAKKKEQEDEARTFLKPKTYDQAEMKAYEEFLQEFQLWFGDLNALHQSSLVKKNLSGNALDQPAEAEEGQDEAKPEAVQTGDDYISKRIIVPYSIEYDLKFLCDNAKSVVPEPVWPDPDKDPLPTPILNQIIRKPQTRPERKEITMFSIWTPTGSKNLDGQETQELGPDGLPQMVKDQSRWVIPANDSLKLYVKFFSKQVGTYNQTLKFEILGSPKSFDLNMQAFCELPTINQGYRNVFFAYKKTRPAQKPESLLSKTFVVSENVFDFGPLLIKKDPEQRHSNDAYRASNSSEFQITNNGKFKAEIVFILKSALPLEEGGTGEKSPFIIEPESMVLETDETKNLIVFAFPDQAKLFKDEIVCLIKNNPNPTIFQVQALGAEPVIEVDQEIVEFQRLLLGKSLSKKLTLKNTSAINAKWKFNGVDVLPSEFKVSETEGMLKPCESKVIEIQFSAKDETSLEPKIILEVEDTETHTIKQEPKSIKLQAEAFKISPFVTIGKDGSQILDFGAVRVGEPKENTITIKNEGKYPIKYSFTRKKKQIRDIFTVEPESDELKPQEEKTIVVRFLSTKEIKLKTSTQTSDMVLNILEGDGKEKEVHQPIPINVDVSAVFSKYQITPLKTINFGPMQYGEQVTRTFEIRNEGHFEFKYAICDDNDKEAKARIKEERQKELEERIHGAQEVVEDPKAAAKGGAKKPDPKAAAKGKDKGGKDVPVVEGQVVSVGQYDINPSIGSIPAGSSAVVSVTFRADGAKFYESVLAIDIGDRDPGDNPGGVPFELCAESSIPGINTQDLDQIFEEQTVIPSLDPQLNTQTIVSSSIYSIMERVFWFGTLVASKNPEGAKERFKIMNPNKIPCTVKFTVKPRSQSKSEGFAFEVSPDTLKIEPHKHKYVTISFNPTAMMQYGAIFEAVVEHGDPLSKTGKLVFELRGEGTLPTLLVGKPEEVDNEGNPVLKFKKTMVGREQKLQIVLKNEGQVPATARFDALRNDNFQFLGNMSHTITQKSYQAFDILFKPKQTGNESFLLTFKTMGNQFEQHKCLLQGEGYQESVTFEGLQGDELKIGDCIRGKPKAMNFTMINNGDKTIKFLWNTGSNDQFKFIPSLGHLKAHSQKQVKVTFKSDKEENFEGLELTCETSQIIQNQTGDQEFKDWDDTMKTVRFVRPSELRKIMADRAAEEKRRREEAEAAAAAATKGKAAAKGKPPTKTDEKPAEEIVIDESEEATAELVDTIPEPSHDKVDATDRVVGLKVSAVCDYGRYDCAITRMDFKPTLMYAQRTHKFSIKNTSKIGLQYNFKICNPNQRTMLLDAGAYSIFPKKGEIPAGCNENFVIKFAPMEVENNFQRLILANFLHLDPEQKPLEIMVDGIAERPVIHFELPPSAYTNSKDKDLKPVDQKYKVLEFESLGTFIKNTRRFMAVNPTGVGYEFEWEEVVDDSKKNKPLFKCLSPKGLILSGKKSEMVFEYLPDNVGEHETQWIFRIPSQNIVQHFLIVGRVNEPNVLFDTGKIKFGPLLLGGKNREVVNLINQEQIPFSFNFTKESVRGGVDYGDSLKVTPMVGTVPAGSQLPIEVLFQPKYELNYNYNLNCIVKRKARPLVLNVKGEGYKIHHSVFTGANRVEIQAGEAFKFDFGEFFINERKSQKVVLQNNGEFNFDFMWKRQVNKYIQITPDKGSVPKNQEIEFEITYLPIGEHVLKSYKIQLQIFSGLKYDFILEGKARRPGVKLSQTVIDFGPCFVSRQPVPLKKILTITNVDTNAISVESDFERKPHLDVQLTPGQVVMPETTEGDKKIPAEALQIPILFTPRELRNYQEKLTLDFNNLYKIDVIIKGEGIPLQLELQDQDQGDIDFGVISVGSDITKTVPIINRSKKPVTFKLQPSDVNQFNKCNISYNPDKEVTLKPKEILPVEVRFNPKSRMPNFDLELMVEVEPNEPRKLLALHGVSHGIELKLMDEVLSFGSVVKGSRLSKLLQLSNFGDVKAHFKWDSSKYSEHFTIQPESGYVNPNSNLDLEVTFHPAKADLDVHLKKIPCTIKGGDKLELNLMGKSVNLDVASNEQLTFNTKVRNVASQQVTIQNTEDREWNISPTISTDNEEAKGFFSGKQSLTIPARSSAQYELQYLPQTMTQTKKVKKPEGGAEAEVEEVQTHKGSLFFPLPNGTALLYRLVGTSNEPDTSGEIQETAVAKKAKSIIIPLKNWSRVGQRFTATWQLEGANATDPACFIRGASTFDVGGNSSKDFKLTFLSLKTGNYRFKVTFKVAKTGEYAFYFVNVAVKDAEVISTIELVTQVRESVSQIISVENPTELEVKVLRTEVVCDNEYIEITPQQIVIPPRSERGFEVHYRPLIALADSQISDLTINNPVLGQFKYKLSLKSQQPNTQRSMAFKCGLGNEMMQTFKFTHFLKKPTNYTVKVERIDAPSSQSDFKAEVATVPATAADSSKGVEISCNIRYEPFTIGDSRAILKLNSPEGMEYTCLLYGKSTPPQPQGPIKCPMGAKPAAIDFKNPMNEKCEFFVNFDNPNFSLASKLPGPLDPGKSTSLQIKYDGKADLPNTGRMIVQTKGLPPWIFYLQGTTA